MNAPLSPEEIEHWPLARLKPYVRNAKTHDADQVAKIAAIMAEFGCTVPVLVAADRELIAGHGCILAAAQLGLTEAPVIVLGPKAFRLRSSIGRTDLAFRHRTGEPRVRCSNDKL